MQNRTLSALLKANFVFLVAVTCTVPSVGTAASIGLHSANHCSGDSIFIEPRIPVSIVIVMHREELPDVLGAEFRITGLPEGWTTAIVPGPHVALATGNPFGSGTEVTLRSARADSCVQLFWVFLTQLDDTTNAVLRPEQHENPQDPLIPCMNIFRSGFPNIPRFCAASRPLHITSASLDVATSTWSQVKALYAR